MYSYSSSSRRNLETCETDIVKLFQAVIKKIDCTIVFGYRSSNLQLSLFNKGRISQGDIVTYSDGFNSKSDHQTYPSIAVDVVPFPSLWRSKENMFKLNKIVMLTAKEMNIKIKWGGDWKRFKDYAHYYLDLD